MGKVVPHPVALRLLQLSSPGEGEQNKEVAVAVEKWKEAWKDVVESSNNSNNNSEEIGNRTKHDDQMEEPMLAEEEEED